MTDLPGSPVSAPGEQSIAAQVLSGIVVTGDYAAIQARTVVLPASGIPRPEQVNITAQLSNLPRAPAPVSTRPVGVHTVPSDGRMTHFHWNSERCRSPKQRSASVIPIWASGWRTSPRPTVT